MKREVCPTRKEHRHLCETQRFEDARVYICHGDIGLNGRTDCEGLVGLQVNRDDDSERVGFACRMVDSWNDVPATSS